MMMLMMFIIEAQAVSIGMGQEITRNLPRTSFMKTQGDS